MKHALKAKLVPVYFKSGKDEAYDNQLTILKELLKEEADIMDPIPLGKPVPGEADAVLFPQLLGDAYQQLDDIQKLSLPLLIVTSEFGTFSMWDWEIIAFLRSKGIETIAPYSLEQTKTVCKALYVKRKLSQSKFIVYQDNPGEGGKQDSIFKRFFWWEDRCIDAMEKKFGVGIEKRSFKELGKRAMNISDSEAEAELKNWSINTSEDLPQKALRNAVKLYLAVKEDIEKEDSVVGVGINCLNESKYSDTTPCLAWNMLYEKKGILWACEADIMSLLTAYIVSNSLDAPVMMSNIYPFLMGQAALKHERIPSFPEIVDEPENHILVAHCGYVGVIPKSFATEWTLRPKVLEIVDENAHVIDARLPTGDITLVKLDPSLSKILAIEGTAKGYVQYPGSDCRNGLVIKVNDGHEVIRKVYSHHQILVPGYHSREIELIGKVMNLEVEIL
jgi:hypothetical protein